MASLLGLRASLDRDNRSNFRPPPMFPRSAVARPIVRPPGRHAADNELNYAMMRAGAGVSRPPDCRHRLPAVNGAYTNEVTLLAHHVDQLELLEHGGDRLETTAYLQPRLDRDAQWGGVVEDETHERMRHRSFAPVGNKKVQAGQV